MQWILFGLLFFSLMTFTISFMFNNSPDAMGSSGDELEGYSTEMRSSLVGVEGDADSLLNISAQNNPEVSDLGSKDSVAVSYGLSSTPKGFWKKMKLFMGWIIVGDAGKVLISVLGGMLGILALYFITKWIRAGF